MQQQQPQESPPAIHVLVVDDDPLSLMVLERMLRRCHYQVTSCTRVAAALQLLREHTETFDLVMSDVYMPDADGFKLLETIGLEMDLPVIMMSANGETSVVMKGITHGACDYLIKPIRMEELKTIWQHVVRRKGTKNVVPSTKLEAQMDESINNESTDMDVEYPIESNVEGSMNEQYECTLDETNSMGTMRKVRVKWSAALHEKFVLAVNELGIDKAAPKKLLELMNVPGLTREHVASHLQKYRSTLKRISAAPQQPPLRDHGTRLQPWQHSSTLPYTTPASGSGLVRSSTIDPGWMDALEKHPKPSVTEQKIVANRAQVLGGLGLKSSGPNPGNIITSSSPKLGMLQRAAVSGSFVSISGNSLMGGGDAGGGLFRMGSLDIGLLLKMQQEEEEMEQQQKRGSRDDMDDLTNFSKSSGHLARLKPAGVQQPGRRPSRLSGRVAGRPMIPMPSPPSGSTQQPTLTSQRRRRGLGPTAVTAIPFSHDINASLSSGAQGNNNDMQLASPSSSSSSSIRNLNTSPTTFSNSSPSSAVSCDSSDGTAGSYSEASSIFRNKVSPR
ncbi:hypothetical protein L7F22_058462 [Adiantum nelumboides]|nr:hypothetical protein [Adiantum nelumboides]